MENNENRLTTDESSDKGGVPAGRIMVIFPSGEKQVIPILGTLSLRTFFSKSITNDF